MSKPINNSYSQNTTFFLVIISAILFAYLGYWYGSTNPGGFSSMSISDLGINNIINGLPRDHPGTVAQDPSNENSYNNLRIGLSFNTPAGYDIRDRWPGDATDLLITASSYEYLSIINTKNEFPQYAQLAITETETIEQLNSWFLPNINNLEEYISAYSKEFVDPNGQTQPASFIKSEKVTIGNVQGYKLTLNEEFAKVFGTSEMYLVGSKGHYYQITFCEAKLKDKVLQTINFY